MQAHDLIHAVSLALKNCTAAGLGGGHDDKERQEFLDLPRQLAFCLSEMGHRDVKVNAAGPVATISTPEGWAVRIEFTAPPASK